MKVSSIITEEAIASKILLIRAQKVMLDSDLAELYGVETKRLNEQVRRNIERFPEDFMFELTPQEWDNLKSQNATSSSTWGGRRNSPFAFTEHGVLMLSSVLSSHQAIAVNIHIIRVFIKMRELLSTHKDVLIKIDQVEKRIGGHDEEIRLILKYLKELLNPQTEPMRRVGFKRKNEN
jgi:hypothetical protein